MSHPLSCVAVDVRMIEHSGIGTAIRGLLKAWKESPPPFSLALMGDAARIAECDISAGCQTASFRQSIYGPGGLRPAPVGDAQVVLGMHYTAPVVLPRRPLVTVVHDIIHITHPQRAIDRPYMRARLAMLRRRASYVITPSRHTKVQLQTLYGFPAHRTLTLPWGPGVVGIAEAEEIPGGLLPEGEFMLSVGILKEHKNWKFLLDRLRDLFKRADVRMPLVVAGLGDKGRGGLLAEARRLGIENRVVVLPRLSDGQMVSLYRRAKVLLFPSLIEGFGFPVAEALACGTRVVAAELPPMNEIYSPLIKHFDPDVPESFDRAVVESITSDKGNGFGEKIDRPSWSKLARDVENVLHRAWNEAARY